MLLQLKGDQKEEKETKSHPKKVQKRLDLPDKLLMRQAPVSVFELNDFGT